MQSPQRPAREETGPLFAPSDDPCILVTHRTSRRVFNVDPETLKRRSEISLKARPIRLVALTDDTFALSFHETPYGVGIVKKDTGQMLLRAPKKASGRESYALESIPSSSAFEYPRFISGDHGKNLDVWHGMTGEHLSSLKLPMDPYTILCVPEWEYKTFVGGGSSNQLWQYDIVKEVKELYLESHKEYVNGLSCDEEKGFLISAGRDKTVKLWARDSMPLLTGTLQLDASAIAVCYAADLNLAFVGTGDGRMEIWDFRNPKSRILKFRPNLQNGPWGGISRLHRTTFFSASYNLASWTSEGKVLVHGRSEGQSYYGNRTFGMPYDVRRDLEDGSRVDRAADLAERVGFLVDSCRCLDVKLCWPAGMSPLLVSRGMVLN